MKETLVIPATRRRVLDEMLDDSSPDAPDAIRRLLESLFPNGHPNLTTVEFIRALCHDDGLAEELQAWRTSIRAAANRAALDASKPLCVTPFKAAPAPIDPPE